MSKKNTTILVGIIFFIIGILSMKFLSGEDTWLCINGQWEKHGNPDNPPPSNIICEKETMSEEQVNLEQNENQKIFKYFSSKNIPINLIDLYEDKEIETPLEIKGEVPGNWFFEASFPIILTDWDGRIIGEAIAQAETDWMTTEMVPFSATINFEYSELYNRGSIIFKKDNPSGLPENDDYLEFTIKFK